MTPRRGGVRGQGPGGCTSRTSALTAAWGTPTSATVCPATCAGGATPERRPTAHRDRRAARPGLGPFLASLARREADSQACCVLSPSSHGPPSLRPRPRPCPKCPPPPGGHSRQAPLICSGDKASPAGDPQTTSASPAKRCSPCSSHLTEATLPPWRDLPHDQGMCAASST